MNKTPKLRFKEFSKNLDHHKFKDLVLLQRGSSPRPISKYVTNSEDGVNWIKIGDVSKDSTVIYETKEKITPEGAKKSRFVGVGDLILSNSMSFGRPYIMAIEGYIHDGWFVLKNYNDNFNRDYLCQLLTSPAIQKQYKRLAAGGVVDNISSELVNSVGINLPSKEEQGKIASFFSLIDDKISLQGEKIDALKDYKKGMMQKIFSRELRFKDDDGRVYPEWEEKKLNELGDTYTGLSGKTKENFGIGEAKYVIYKNVFGNTLAKVEEVDLVEINKGENQNKVIKGDLLFTTSSETPEEVGMISCWNYDIDDLYLNSFCFGYRLSDMEECSPIFMAYLLRSEAYRRKISILGQGSTRYNISKTELMKMMVSVPVIDEQRKIVGLLLGIEGKIEKEQEKLNSLNEYKKGLLQQMFV